MAFVSASTLNFLAEGIHELSESVGTEEDPNTILYICYAVLIVLTTICWKYVQIVILLVFVKYGKPLEEDTRVLLAKKMFALSQEQEMARSNSETRFYKRKQAYEEIAD